MIDICTLRDYFEKDMVFVTNHATERFRQRNISIKDIRNAVITGEIIEQYPDDYPFPSCLIMGHDLNKRQIHIVMSDGGEASKIITAYIPSPDKWEADLKIRKEISL